MLAVPTALASEYILGFRVDQKLGNNDNMFGRYKLDHGVQPTYLDAVNPAFDANSSQPSWDAQVQETHVFGPTMTNSFTAIAEPLRGAVHARVVGSGYVPVRSGL